MDNTPFNFKYLEVFVTLAQAKLEEELTQASYEASKLLRQGVDTFNRFTTQLPAFSETIVPHFSENPDQTNAVMERQVEQRLESVEQLLNKMHHLVEQLCHQSERFAAFDARIAELETAKEQSNPSPSGTEHGNIPSQPQLSALEHRVAAIEDSISSISLLAGEIGDRSEIMIGFNNRLTNLERLMQRASVLPRVIDQQGQILIDLEDRLSRIEESQSSSQTDNSPQNPSLYFEDDYL